MIIYLPPAPFVKIIRTGNYTLSWSGLTVLGPGELKMGGPVSCDRPDPISQQGAYLKFWRYHKCGPTLFLRKALMHPLISMF